MSSDEPNTGPNIRRRALLGAGSCLLAGLTGLSGCLSRMPVVGRNDDEARPHPHPHIHGYLLVSIDGEELSFEREKFLRGTSDRVTSTFHFHATDEPNRWHLEGERLVLAAALDALPDLSYRSEDSAHVLRIDGHTYDESNPGTEIAITERYDPIDPTTYRLHSGDVIYIRITTDGGPAR